MTLSIFNSDGKTRDIQNVIRVLNHSTGTAEDNGNDIEIWTAPTIGEVITTEKIHLTKWEFYSVRA